MARRRQLLYVIVVLRQFICCIYVYINWLLIKISTVIDAFIDVVSLTIVLVRSHYNMVLF